MNTYLRFPNGRTRALTLSYDDGVTTDIHLLSLMQKYGICGTFNINCGCFSTEEKEYPKGKWGRMTEGQTFRVFDDKHAEIAVHAYTHPFLQNLPVTEVCNEIIRDREIIEKHTGKPCTGMAYPYGSTSDTVVSAIGCCGISYSRTTVSTGKFDIPNDWLRMPATCHHNDPRLFELAEAFLSGSRYPHGRLFYLWGHSYEFERDDNWERIETFFKIIGGIEDIWYATNIDIFDYVCAYRNLRWSIDRKSVANTSSIPVWFALDLEAGIKSFCVESGETITII